MNKKVMIWFVGGWLLAILLPPQRVVSMFKKSA